MNETNDPLEEELAAYHPQELSPEFHRRIAGRLAAPAPKAPRWLFGIALAGGLAAACLAAVLFRQGDGQSADMRPTVVGPRPASEYQVEHSTVPTLQAYRQALARSSEELDALLDKHAARARRPDPQLVRTHAFLRSDRESQAFTGEL